MIEYPSGDDWVALFHEALPLAEAPAWAITPSCGALVTFAGTVRDHATGRDDVQSLEYEAYDEHVVPKLQAVVDEARRRWPMLGRVVAIHRTGLLSLSEVAVIIAATSPSRPEAFEAARFLIDTVKATVPIWKLETWAGGAEWSEGDCEVAATHVDVDHLTSRVPAEQ
ncbi:MAG TPA: molybdenum cofactor biosynthesis protein MoaE [Acidimicrobiales bacterium]